MGIICWCFKSSKKVENISLLEELCSFFEILPFTEAIDKRFGSLLHTLERKGHPIGVMDTLIASIGLEYDLPVLTRNIKHFEKAGVKIETW